MFSIEGCPYYSGDFVLATLLDSVEDEQQSTSSIKSQSGRDLSATTEASLADKPPPRTAGGRDGSHAQGQNHERISLECQATNRERVVTDPEGVQPVNADYPNHGSQSHAHRSQSHAHGSQTISMTARSIVPETVTRGVTRTDETIVIDDLPAATSAEHEFMEGLFELDDDDELTEVPKGGSVFGFVEKPHAPEQLSTARACTQTDTTLENEDFVSEFPYRGSHSTFIANANVMLGLSRNVFQLVSLHEWHCVHN